MILWWIVVVFFDRSLYTLLPCRFVVLNSEIKKSPELFGGFMLYQNDSQTPKKYTRAKYIDSMKKLCFRFSPQVSQLRVPAPCCFLFNFRQKTQHSEWLSVGGHQMVFGTGSTRPHTSKTIPGREKKPIDQRDSHGGVRCCFLLLPILDPRFPLN